MQDTANAQDVSTVLPVLVLTVDGAEVHGEARDVSSVLGVEKEREYTYS
jgi:hypothetical protein